MATAQKSPEPPGDIEDQVRQIRSDIAELTKALRKLAEAKAGEAGAAAQDEAERLAQRARAMADSAQGKAREATEALEDHIKEKPIQSALIALVIGLLFGALSRR